MEGVKVGPEISGLHVGGEVRKEGWLCINALEGLATDVVGRAEEVGTIFAEDQFEKVLASHCLEHVAQENVVATLAGWLRVLKPNGGRAFVSVPDLRVLSALFLRPELTLAERYHVMRMMFGGQTTPHDFHYVGFDEPLLRAALERAGFARAERVVSFGQGFADTSELEAYGERISLNIVAYK